jgi:hypothetical protein
MAGSRRLKLRRPDACVVCGTTLAAGTIAFWNVEAQSVTCLDCLERRHVQSDDAAQDSVASEAELLDRGKAGSSASQRHAFARAP